MATKSATQHVEMTSPIQEYLAVQPVGNEDQLILDGPIHGNEQDHKSATAPIESTTEGSNAPSSELEMKDPKNDGESAQTKHNKPTFVNDVELDEEIVHDVTEHPQTTVNDSDSSFEHNPIVSDTTDDIAITSGDDTAIEEPEKLPASQSSPPDLRPRTSSPASQAPAFNASEYSQPKPQRYEQHHHNPTYPRHARPFPPFRGGDERQDIARLTAEKMKLQSDLSFLQKEHTSMREKLTAEIKETMANALANMTTDLLLRQTAVLAKEGVLESETRDLEYLEKRIVEMEIFLAEGQKRFHYERQKIKSERTFVDVHDEYIQRLVDLQVKKEMLDEEGAYKLREEKLRLREEALDIKEKGYKALLYAEGKGEKNPAAEEKLSDDYLEGYKDCQALHIAMEKLKRGVIEPGSQEMDRLVNTADPKHPFNIGFGIGRKELEEKKSDVKGLKEVKNVRPTFASEFGKKMNGAGVVGAVAVVKEEKKREEADLIDLN